MTYTDLSEVRGLPGLDDEVAFPDALVTECIARAEALITDYCGPWAPTSITTILPGGAGSVISTGIPGILSLDAIAFDGVEQDISGWTSDFYGDVYLDETVFGVGTISVTVTAGLQATPPPPLKWAAQTLAKAYVLEHDSATPERALAVQSEFGQIQIAQAGGKPDRPTAFPDVNAAMNRYRKGPVIG